MTQTGFRTGFPTGHVALPVIHVVSQDHALRKAEITRSAGATGMLLINHGLRATQLLQIHETVCLFAACAERSLCWWPTLRFRALSARLNGSRHGSTLPSRMAGPSSTG